MPFTRYDIYFSGQIIADQDPEQVKQNVAKLFKMERAKAERLFSGKPIRIKENVDQDTAIKYRGAFTKAGALIDIKPTQEAPPASSDTPSLAGSSEDDHQISLMGANTGSLADCAPKVEPAILPDTSAISLSPEGSVVDDSAPEPEVHIDTSELSLNPAENGSLEDCHTPPEPTPIPDISGIELTPAHSSSLEDCHTEPDAAPIPDTSDIQLADANENPEDR